MKVLRTSMILAVLILAAVVQQASAQSLLGLLARVIAPY